MKITKEIHFAFSISKIETKPAASTANWRQPEDGHVTILMAATAVEPPVVAVAPARLCLVDGDVTAVEVLIVHALDGVFY